METLEGRLVRLEPLTEAHFDGLLAACSEDRSSYGFTTVPTGSAELRSYLDRAFADRDAGEGVPFAQVERVSGRVVGTTRFTNLRLDDSGVNLYAVEIGWTWLAASAQRTGINVEAKLLLIGHAFEVWRVGRVDLKTDSRNARSQKAIGALGASFEGILRNWQPSHAEGEQGQLRDTAMFSLVAGEWPEAKLRLQARLESAGGGR